MGGHMLIGAGAGYSGDRLDAPLAVVRDLRAAGGRSAIIFETLGERTLALAQLRRRENPSTGYEPKLAPLLAPVLKVCIDGGIAIVGNFGAANPAAAAQVIADLADQSGTRATIGVVTGDDMLGADGLDVLRACCDDLPDPKKLVSANAYLGAAPDCRSARQRRACRGDRPCRRSFAGARAFDPSPSAGRSKTGRRSRRGTMAGHLLECGAQVTGGYFADPGAKDVPWPREHRLSDCRDRPSTVISSSARRPGGGLVDRRTVTEQFLYEVHDPAAYLTPDVIADISEVKPCRTWQ